MVGAVFSPYVTVISFCPSAVKSYADNILFVTFIVSVVLSSYVTTIFAPVKSNVVASPYWYSVLKFASKLSSMLSTAFSGIGGTSFAFIITVLIAALGLLLLSTTE